MHKVQLWPQVSDEVKAHAISLVLGRYLTTAMLISHFTIDTWLAHVAGLLEVEIQKLAAEYGEPSEELSTTQKPGCGERADFPVSLSRREHFAVDTIRRWKTERSIRQRFPLFIDWLEHCEKLVIQGFANSQNGTLTIH